jgi:hypothetical protein
LTGPGLFDVSVPIGAHGAAETVLEDAAKVDIVEEAQQFVPAGQDARLLNHENARRSFQNIGHSESSHHDGTQCMVFCGIRQFAI